MKQLPLFFCGILLISSFVTCRNGKNEHPSQTSSREAIRVTVFLVRPVSYTEIGRYEGRILPVNEVKLICYNGGRVEALRAKEGDIVKNGASLAAIDSAKAIVQLKTAKLQEKIATMNLEQTRKHLKAGNASPLSVDKAELDLLVARYARIEAQKNYRGALVITPVAGTVTNCPIGLYQELSPGSPTFTVSQTGLLNVVFSIDKTDLPYIKVGNTAKITLLSNKDKSWSGSIQSVVPGTSGGTFDVEVALINSALSFKSGITATVEIELRHLENAILVPTRCIHTEGPEFSVMTVNQNNRVFRRMVTPGKQTDSLTFIKEGLVKGDRVVMTRYDLMQDGMQVQIVEK